MKTLFTKLLIAMLLSSSAVQAQYFIADIRKSKDTLIFSIIPVTTITDKFSDVEFYIRWKASSGNSIVFGPTIPNQVSFPSLQMDSWNNDVADPGYNNQHFGHLIGTTTTKTYTNGTTYEVFRTVMSGGIPSEIEMVADNTNVDPYYFTVHGVPIDYTAYDPLSPFNNPTGSSGTFFYKTLDLTDKWIGTVDDNWDNAANWLSGFVPKATKSVSIGAGKPFYPVIIDSAVVHDLNIEAGGSVTVLGKLKIAGAISNAGTLDVSNGTIELNGSSLQTMNATDFANHNIKNLIISNDVSLNTSDTLTGVLTVAGGMTFVTNDSLILHSNVNGTARVATLPVDGTGVATAFITGKITIERYIPAHKAWRLLGVPLDSTNAPSINESWQEGLTTSSANPNLYPGYGVFIQGGTIANGFDHGLTSISTIRVFNDTSDDFMPLPLSPGTNTAITNYPGYFIYLRGDRSIDMMQGNAADVTSTTLRMKGLINTGDQQTNVNASHCTLLSNPFPSTIDFETVTRTNVKNSFYMWDPKLTGPSGLGGYVAFSWNETTGSYDATASVSPLSKYIPSGEAIFVESEDGTNPGTITFKESDKTAEGSDDAFGRETSLMQGLRVNLYAIEADSGMSLLDGVLTTYSEETQNSVDKFDTKKLSGSSECIDLLRDDVLLAIERRNTILKNDTSFLALYRLMQKAYNFEIITKELDVTGMIGMIKDKYSSDINDMPLNMNGVTNIPFTVNSDPASYAVDRFSIVFMKPATLAVGLTNLKAYPQHGDVVVEWVAQNETDVKYYQVERSVDGTVFSSVNKTQPTALNGGTASYKFIDTDPNEGMNYYRIVSKESNAKSNYSNIVKVNMQQGLAAPSISVYPNPVTGNSILMELNNVERGNYSLQLFNTTGQLLASKTIEYDGSATVQKFDLSKTVATGTYELRLSGRQVNIRATVLKR